MQPASLEVLRWWQPILASCIEDACEAAASQDLETAACDKRHTHGRQSRSERTHPYCRKAILASSLGWGTMDGHTCANRRWEDCQNRWKRWSSSVWRAHGWVRAAVECLAVAEAAARGAGHHGHSSSPSRGSGRTLAASNVGNSTIPQTRKRCIARPIRPLRTTPAACWRTNRQPIAKLSTFKNAMS